MSEKNIYAQILDAIADGESVSMNTKIQGESGQMADGLKRTLEIVPQDAGTEGLAVVKPTAVKTGCLLYTSYSRGFGRPRIYRDGCSP